MQTVPIATRLEQHAQRIAESGCWAWLGAVNDDGYGRVNLAGKNKHAHRVSYELAKGPIPEGLVLDHLCKVRCCINPDHLEPVTIKENLARGNQAHKGKLRRERTHCVNGHEYLEQNTYWRGSHLGDARKWRVCKICHNAQRRKT